MFKEPIRFPGQTRNKSCNPARLHTTGIHTHTQPFCRRSLGIEAASWQPIRDIKERFTLSWQCVSWLIWSGSSLACLHYEVTVMPPSHATLKDVVIATGLTDTHPVIYETKPAKITLLLSVTIETTNTSV